jgi:hypothetical protein
MSESAGHETLLRFLFVRKPKRVCLAFRENAIPTDNPPKPVYRAYVIKFFGYGEQDARMKVVWLREVVPVGVGLRQIDKFARWKPFQVITANDTISGLEQTLGVPDIRFGF